MKRILLALSVAALAFVSCTDLSDVYSKIDENTTRIDALEKKSNDLENLLKAIQNNVSVTSVKETQNGYTITFSDGTTAILKNGEQGPQGPQGPAGAAAATPSFKVDDNGIIYVSLDGGQNWSALGSIKGPKGDAGDPGQDGEDGPAPQFKVEDGVLYIRYSDTAEWTSLGSLKGEDGKDGADGASPLFKLDEATGDLYVRYSESEEWTLVGNARGEIWIKSIRVVDCFLVITTNENYVYTLFMGTYTLRDVKFVPEYSDGLATLTYYDSSNAAPMKLNFTVGGDTAAIDEFLFYVDNRTNDYMVYIYALPVKTRAAADETVKKIAVNVSAISRERTMLTQYESFELYTITIENPASLLAENGERISLVDGNYELAIEIASRYMGSNCARTDFFQIHKECLSGTLEYDGVTYKTVKMADGRWWMAENLRYVPTGCTVSNNFTDSDGIWYPANLSLDTETGKYVATVTTAPEDVAKMGLLYTEAVALAGETIPQTDWTDVENNQGICPDGWHIPTAQEWVDLVGGCSASAHVNTSAPYYSSAVSGAQLADLNAAYFNFLPYPYVNIGTSYLATVANVNESSPYCQMSSISYFASSTGRTEKQTYSAMITNNKTKSSVNVAYNNLTNGVFVRCIKNLD